MKRYPTRLYYRHLTNRNQNMNWEDEAQVVCEQLVQYLQFDQDEPEKLFD